MPRTIASLLFILITTQLVAQKPSSSTIQCDDTSYTERRGAWRLNLPKDCKYTTYTNNFQEILSKHLSVIETIESSIIERGGEDFYKRLMLISIDLTNNPKKCSDVSYVLRYVLKIKDAFNYRFSIYFDENGNNLSPYGFPDASESPDFFSLVNACDFVEVAKKDSVFIDFYEKKSHKSVENISLVYDSESDSFLYSINGRFILGKKQNTDSGAGWWYGRNVLFNAVSGEKVRTDKTKIYRLIPSGY